MKTVASAMSDANAGRSLWTALAIAAVVRFWIMPLGSSLWLDEFGTYWVTDAGFGEILSRSRLFPQSVPYASVVWLARALGGSSEIALRLPSLLAAGLAAYVLYRLGLELFDRETGLLATGIFVAFPQICFAAGDARPYAFAVFATIGALWMLVRWLERGRAIDALGYVLFATATIYFQYLFATTLVVHALYALRRWRRGWGVRLRHLLLAAAAIVLLTVPAAALMLEIGRDRALHAFKEMPGMDSFVLALAPSRVLADLLLSFFVCWNLGLVLGLRPFPGRGKSLPGRQPRRPTPRDAQWLLSLSVVIPVALLFVVSRVSGTSVFVARYLMCMIPGQALLIAWLIRTAQPIGGQWAIVACYLLILLVERGGLSRLKITHTDEDWRGAIAAIRAINGSHPVLMSGMYIESRNLAWVQDAKHYAYMRAPLDFYPTGGHAVILPLLVSREAESYVERLLDSTPGLEDRFALIERSSHLSSWAGWLDERLKLRGYTMRKVWDRDNPRAWVFERSAHRASSP